MNLYQRCYKTSFAQSLFLCVSKCFTGINSKNIRFYIVKLLGLCAFLIPTSVGAQIPIDVRGNDTLRLLTESKAPMLWGQVEHLGKAWITPISRPYTPTAGLSGRHLFVWPSHGRYFNSERWAWQRPILFCTTEDLLTPSFVFPYLIPMLEKAGAIVYTPRERDAQTNMYVVDNDQPGRDGSYIEDNVSGSSWQTGNSRGFSMPLTTLNDGIQPFVSGTLRTIPTTQGDNVSRVTWAPRITSPGNYSVYVSYATLPHAVSDAHYTVSHAGQKTEFHVNQQMGGGTWFYLGTFYFEAGNSAQNYVTLNNKSKEHGVVCADAVRFGGGMSITERNLPQVSFSTDSTRIFTYPKGPTSRLPRQLEGARYHAQWSGLPDSLYRSNPEGSDYNDDIRVRPLMLNYLNGGSIYNPDTLGAKVPFELSFALHTDAGYLRNGGIYGSLGIITSKGDKGEFEFRSGLSRRTSYGLAEQVLTSVTSDLSQVFDLDWRQRDLTDKNYGETRLPQVPSMILELLAHQNFTDMKYAHDPNFKFVASRAIYKAMLRYVAQMHGQNNVVIQPLPVNSFSASLVKGKNEVKLSWSPTKDSLEFSATPTDYIVYTREAGKDFNNGQRTRGQTSLTLPIESARHYEFRVTALNDGGESFPSETLSVYCSKGHREGNTPEVLVVNGFYRLSGPARVESDDSLGFDLSEDIGVPYDYTTAFTGKQTNFERSAMGRDGINSLGYGTSELVGKVIAGNRFDGVSIHTSALSSALPHVSVSSMSQSSFVATSPSILNRYAIIAYMAGKERDVKHNLLSYKSLPTAVRTSLQYFTQQGGSVFLSGSYIGSDMTSADEQQFLQEVFSIRSPGRVANDTLEGVWGMNAPISLYNRPNAQHYHVQHTDVLEPTSTTAFSAFSYGKGGYSAAVANIASNKYRSLILGFPFECIQEESLRKHVMKGVFKFLLPKD